MISRITPDLKIDSLRMALRQLDPHASIVLEGLDSPLRVRSLVSDDEVRRIADSLGLRPGQEFSGFDLGRRGSECCGGCSG